MTDNSDRVLILDSDGQAGLSLVRSLGRRGVSVTAGSSRRLSLGRLSRYSDSAYVYPEPTDSADRFVDHLVDYLETVDHSIVFPVRDKTSTLLSAHKAEIERTGTTVAAEDWDTYVRAYDKGRLFALADSLPVPTPETYEPASLAEVEEVATEISHPALVKPRSKTVWDGSGTCHYTRVDDSMYADSPEELFAAYREVLERNPFLEEQTHYPLVQEYVPGETTTTVVLAEDGAIRADFQEERVRTYPSSGGNSTLLRGLCDPRMRDYASSVIDALEWTGPAMVEFMRTPDDEYYLIEVNGRYWGSVPFAIESDVDIPWLHYRQLQGETIEQSGDYRTDFHQQRLINEDLKWLIEQLKRGNATALLRCLWTCATAKQTFVSSSDPAPTIWAPVQTAGLGAREVVRRIVDVEPRLEVLFGDAERS